MADNNTIAQTALYLENTTFTAQPGYLWQGLSQTVSETTYGAVYLAANGALTGGGTADNPIIFRDNHSSEYGNAITANAGNSLIDLDYVVFEGNTSGATQGGALWAGGNVDLLGATFAGNAVSSVGGAWYARARTATVTDSLFSGNSATANGGAIYNYGSKLTLTNSTFCNNTAGNLGGVIRSDEELHVIGGLFDGNSAAEGGVLWNLSGRTASFSGTTFTNNHASYGGVFAGNGIVSFTGSTFAGNYATTIGGAIYLSSGTMEVTDSVFSGNTSSSHGGAVYNYGGSMTIRNVTFNGNSSTAGYGGALFNNATTTVTNAMFSNHCAKEGGAIQNAAGKTLTITGSTFTGNQLSVSGNWGGAIINYGNLYIGDVVFDSNTGRGGAIGTINGSVIITGKLTLKTATDNFSSSNSTFTIDVASFGSGNYYLVIDAYAATLWNDVTYTVSDSNYVCATAGKNLYIKNKNIDFTTAILSAGGTASSVVVSGETVTGVAYDFADLQTATALGATRIIYKGLPIDEKVTVAAATEGIYVDSTASGLTAGVFQNNGTLTVSGGTFVGNSKGDAGAIYNSSNCTLTVTGATFSGNTATAASGWGGAIMSYGSLTIGDVVFDGNYAKNGGAIAAIGNGTTIISTVNIIGKVTLKTANDSIKGSSATFKIDASEFGSDDYYVVIDAYAASLWNSATYTVINGDDYVTANGAKNLYIKNKNVDFSTAILSAGGTATSVVVSGETVTGYAYDFADLQVATDLGATSIIYKGLQIDEKVTVAAATEGIYVDSTASGLTNGVFQNNGTLTVSGGTFTGNSRSEAGVIYNGANRTLTVTGATFSGNTATAASGWGGVVMSYGTLNIGDVVFDGNYAKNGGAIGAIGNGKDTISTVNIIGKLTLKTANDTIRGASTTFTIDASKFGSGDYYTVIDAYAASLWNPYTYTVTGGDYVTAQGATDLYIKKNGVDFTTAILSAGGTASSVVVSGETVTGVAYDFADLQVATDLGATRFIYKDSSITERMTVASSDDRVYVNTSASGIDGESNGGVIYSSGKLTLAGGTFADNSTSAGGGVLFVNAKTVNVTDLLFDGNTAANGGAIYNEGTKVTLTNSTFSSNTAGSLGGVIRNEAALEITGGIFRQNSASEGGVAWNRSYGTVAISGATFADNHANYGGALSCNGSVTVADAEFNGNDSAVIGGAIYVASGTTTVTGSQFTTNRSDTHGGAIYNNGGTLSIAGSVFSGNTASSGSGAAVYNNATAAITNSVFSGNTATGNGGAICNNATMTVTGGSFAGNRGSEGGAIYNGSNRTLTITGATFSGNTATAASGWGGAVISYGTLNLGNVVFDGNYAKNGGAIGAIGNGTSIISAVNIIGKVTLKTATDTIASASTTFTIDASQFGSNDYYKVIDAVNTTQWAAVSGAEVSGDYAKETFGTNLYIVRNDADFTTVILSADGSVSETTVGGTVFSGAAIETADEAFAKTKNPNNWVYVGYQSSGTTRVGGNAVSGDRIAALANSTLTSLYGADNDVSGNFSVILDNTTASGAVYGVGDGGVSGKVSISLVGSSVGGNLAPHSGDLDSHSTGYEISLSGSTVTGTLRGTGSSRKIATDYVNISLNDSYAGNITCLYGSSSGDFYGNVVSGPVSVTLTGSSVGGNIVRKNANYTTENSSVVTLTVNGANTVGGAIQDVDVITVNAGATLTANSISTAANFVNNGTVTVGADSTLNIADGCKLGNLTVNAGTLTVNASAITTGVSYSAVTLNNDAALTVTGNAFKYGTDKVVYYNVIDSTLGTHSTGDIVSVTINGVATDAIYGVNAFTSRDQVTNSAAVVVANEEIKTDTNLGGGTNVITSGTTLTANLYGASSGTVSSVDLTLRGASSSKTVLGGGSTLDSVVTGNIALKLEDATVDRIVYGGGQSGTVTGSITTTISGDSVISKNFYGGSLITGTAGGNGYSIGAVNVAIEGGSFGGHIVGGSRVNGSSNETESVLGQTVDSVTLNVTGGSFFANASIFAGGYVAGYSGGTVGNANLIVEGAVSVTLNADVLTTPASSGVYGGALASAAGIATISGSVSITVEGGHYSTIYGAGWAESKAKSQVAGGVAITVKGGSIGNLYAGGNNDTSGATANVTGGGAIIRIEGGTIENVYAASKYGTSKITGNTEVEIKGGTITGTLSGWNKNDGDSVTGTQTLDLDASVSCGTVKGFDVWEVAANATLDADTAIDLNKVTLNLDAAAWDVASSDVAIDNLETASGVTIGGVAAEWVTDGSYWKATVSEENWKLSVEDSTLKLSKLA